VLADLTQEEIKVCLEQMDRPTAATTLQYVNPWIGSQCLLAWPEERTEAVLERLPIASLARMVRLLTGNEQTRVLALAPRSVTRIVRSVIRYPEDTAADWAELDRYFFSEDLPISQVWKLLRRQGESVGPYIYGVDKKGTLVGVASLGEVLAAQPRVPLDSIMHHRVEHIVATDRRAAVVKHPAWQRFPTLPVVDDEGILLGRIRYSALRHLEKGLESGAAPDTWRHLALSLAELYWVSTSKLFRVSSGALAAGLTPVRDREGGDDT
jgi:magnesium transporter